MEEKPPAVFDEINRRLLEWAGFNGHSVDKAIDEMKQYRKRRAQAQQPLQRK